MSNNTEAQNASREAARRLREENPERWEALMHEEYGKRGLTWRRRLSAEERAERKAEAEKAAAVSKIKAMAEKAGVGVLLVDDASIEAKMVAAADGTSEGVTMDWRDDSDKVAALVASEAEHAESLENFEPPVEGAEQVSN